MAKVALKMFKNFSFRSASKADWQFSEDYRADILIKPKDIINCLASAFQVTHFTFLDFSQYF